MKQDESWNAYFELTKMKPPSDTAINALKQFGSFKSNMIDLGCGVGNDSLYFLEYGWNVLAVDWQPDFVIQLRKEMPKDVQNRFEIAKMKFEELKLPDLVDCITANFSLPFCDPNYFEKMWNEIVCSIREDGIFSGVFFGDRDEWATKMSGLRTFHSKEQAMNLFKKFRIIDFNEEEFEGTCCGRNGEKTPKHWHIFKVVAKKVIDKG